MLKCVLASLFFFPLLLNAGTVRLNNNSPFDLRAVIRGSDGSYLAEVVVKAQKGTVWTDSFGQYGMTGGANADVNRDYRSKTPYTVLWYCLDGGAYGVCDTVSTGAVVTAAGCTGSRTCKPQKQELYPREPEGNYLYNPKLAPPLTQ